MATADVYSLKHFLELMEDLEEAEAERYSFYAVLLYAPINGLNARLHEYMTTHWIMMDGMTGLNWLLLAVEDLQSAKPTIEDFKPQDIYHIARHLGQLPDVIPCLVFFVDPQHRNNTLTLSLSEFFGTGDLPNDDELTDFFQNLAKIVHLCSDEPPEKRLQCLDRRVGHEWPEDSHWAQRARQATGWVVASVTTASTIVAALTPALHGLRSVFYGA